MEEFKEIEAKIKEKIEAAIEHLKADLTKMRAGRATAGLLEPLVVDYYGSKVPIMQMGLISVPEPRQLTVQVFDAGAVEAVEKAIMESGLGFNPMREGSLLRIPVPSLTAERRDALVKKVLKMGEDTRIVVRNQRRDALDEVKKLEKKKIFSEDDSRRAGEQIQKIIDGYISAIDHMIKEKEKDIAE